MIRRSRSTGRLKRGEEHHAQPTYSSIRTNMLKLTPGDMKCRMYCSGKRCKYCNVYPSTSEEQGIPGLYSTWVTPQVLAMARPTAAHTNLVEAFKKAGIRTVINLQEPGEHKFCGPSPLLASGFTYDPEELFMANDIFFYNFPMPDFRTCSVAFLLDVVKVMQFGWEQGKIAVHCHAGHGRTGMLIAAFLIYWEGVTPLEAVRIVREKRPDSVQSMDQVTVLNDLHKMLLYRANVLPTVTTLITGGGRWCPLCGETSSTREVRQSIFTALFTKRVEKKPPGQIQVSYASVLDFERDYLAGPERKDFRQVPKTIVTIVKLLLERVFKWATLHMTGNNINNSKVEWEVGPRIAKFNEIQMLTETFPVKELEPCSVCTFLRDSSYPGGRLVTVSNCGYLLKLMGANYCTLIALLDRTMQELEKPDHVQICELITVNTNLAGHMGAHTDEPWKAAFAVIVSAFSHSSSADYPYFAQMVTRFFLPDAIAAGQILDSTCARIQTLMERLAETRRFWHENELREEDRRAAASESSEISEDGTSETYRKISAPAQEIEENGNDVEA